MGEYRDNIVLVAPFGVLIERRDDSHYDEVDELLVAAPYGLEKIRNRGYSPRLWLPEHQPKGPMTARSFSRLVSSLFDSDEGYVLAGAEKAVHPVACIDDQTDTTLTKIKCSHIFFDRTVDENSARDRLLLKGWLDPNLMGVLYMADREHVLLKSLQSKKSRRSTS